MLAAFEAEGIKSKPLVTSHAFHSQLLDPILEPLGRFASTLTTQPPRIPLISNLTGQPADERTYADPSYWVTHARSPVQFAMGMQTLADSGCDVFLEIGPAPTLIGMGQRCVSGETLRWLTSLRPGRDDWQTMLESLAELYVAGVPVDWRGFDRDYSRRLADLPHYPFQRKRFWAKSAELSVQVGTAASSRRGPSLHPLLGHRLAAAVSDRVFETEVAANRPSILADHKIQGAVIMPGAAYLEMALAASAAVYGQPWEVCETALVEPLLLNKQPKTIQTILTPQGDKAATFRIVSFDDESGDDEAANPEPVFKTHAVGRLEAPTARWPRSSTSKHNRPASPIRRWMTPGASRRSANRDLEYGPSFCWVPLHWLNGQDAWAQLREVRDSDHAAGYHVHPGLLDCAFQLLGATLPGAGTGIDTYVPMTVGRLRLREASQQPAWFQASLTSLERDYAIGDITMLDAEGRVLMEVRDLRLRRVPRDWLARLVAEPQQDWTYELAWQEQPLASEAANEADHEPGRWLVFDSQRRAGRRFGRAIGIEIAYLPGRLRGRPGYPPRGGARIPADAAGASRGIVYLTGIDVDGSADGQTPDFAAARDRGWGGVLDVLQAISETGSSQPPRLWLVTRGAQPAGEAEQPLALAQSPLWGLGRVIAAEHPELECTRIDLDPLRPADEADCWPRTSCWPTAKTKWLSAKASGWQLVCVPRGAARPANCGFRAWRTLPAGDRFARTTGSGRVACRPARRARTGASRNPGPRNGPELPRRAERVELVPWRSGTAGRRMRGRGGRGRRRRRTRQAGRPSNRPGAGQFRQLRPDLGRIRDAEAGDADLRARGDHPDRLPVRLLRALPFGTHEGGRTSPDPCRLGWRGIGGHPTGATSRRGDLRHGGQPEETRVPESLGHPARDGLAFHRLRQPDHGDHRRRGHRPGAQFVDRRDDRQQSVRAARRRPIPGTGQDRSLGSAAGGHVSAWRGIPCHRVGSHDGRAAERGPRVDARSRAAVRRPTFAAAAAADVPGPARGGCVAAHGAGRAHRQGGDRGPTAGRRERDGLVPRRRHLPGDRRTGRTGVGAGPLAGPARRAALGAGRPIGAVGRSCCDLARDRTGRGAGRGSTLRHLQPRRGGRTAGLDLLGKCRRCAASSIWRACWTTACCGIRRASDSTA
jgi:malonyl CoA-acyl carrier protein transacylase